MSNCKDANKCIEVCYTESNFDGQISTSKVLRRMHTQQEARILVDGWRVSWDMYKFIISKLSHVRVSATAMKKSNLFY